MSHSLLSPSSAHRWITCPGSVTLSKGLPDDSSEYADEGTRAHEVAACRLKGIPGPAADSDETSEFVNVYVAAIRRAAEGKMLFIEERVPTIGEPGAAGTADAIIYDADFHTLEVHDLKFGKGILVYAQENEQLMLYALGAIQMIDTLLGQEVTSVKLVIHQPRRDHLSEWECSVADLRKFAKRAAAAAITALEAYEGAVTPTLNPAGKACQWCPAKSTCAALASKVHDEVMADFGTIGEVMPTPDVIDMVEAWVKAVKEKIHEKLNNREPVEGWKLVAGKKGNRVWSSQDEVEKLVAKFKLKKEAYTQPELLSPAQLEKVVTSKERWEQFKALISQAEGKPTMAPEADPRPALELATAADFHDLTGLEALY